MDGAMIPEVKDQIVDLIGCKEEDILLASGRKRHRHEGNFGCHR
jgi:hypothetical protein